MSAVRTTCPYCGVGCGITAAPDGRSSYTIAGDPSHAGNRGRVCSKGAALGETLGRDGRLLHPVVDGRRTDWPTALRAVADAFAGTIREHGPDAVALYVSGQLLTEDYYVANKLMKGYIGSANIDTNSRLCMSSAVMGHKRAFGADVVPGCYEDIDLADMIVLVGANSAWCHPVIFQRIAAAKQARPQTRIVVVDPRRSPSCELADSHLGLVPGTDAVLFNGLLASLDAGGWRDEAFVASHTDGADAALAAAKRSAPNAARTAETCGLPTGDVEAFFEAFARTPRVVTLWSQGINQSSSGTDKVNAIINCHLLTGRVGRPGAGPFSLTGQPNAMGGREVGGLATTLAAHMSIESASDRARVKRFWRSPTVCEKPGLTAIDLFEAVHAGRIKALWIIATNPVVSLPDADRVREALERCRHVIVSDCYAQTDTLRCARIALPALAWGEKDGTVTSSERRISRQRAFLPPPEEARPDWWMLCEVGKRLGFAEGFDYRGPHEIFDEHARLSAYENGGVRAFDIGALSAMTRAEYDALEPVQWPVGRTDGNGGRRAGTARLFGDGRFYTPNRRACFVAVDPRPPARAPNAEYPLVLNTGRVRDHWHTMTRTGRSPRLSAHACEPYVHAHPMDALAAGVRDGTLARVATKRGAIVVRCLASPDVRRGTMFVPIHWNDAFASDARVGRLIESITDPVSGEPELKAAPARLEPFPVDWHGFILSRRPLGVDRHCYWVRATGKRFLRYELAGRGAVDDWPEFGRTQLGVDDADADWLEVRDAAAGLYRAAHAVDGRIEACIFVSPRPDLPSRAWLSKLFVKETLDVEDRMGLLAGMPLDASADTGPPVCACFGIGRETLVRAIRRDGLRTPAAIGEALEAGTNCGSCLPEIRALIDESQRAEPSETTGTG